MILRERGRGMHVNDDDAHFPEVEWMMPRRKLPLGASYCSCSKCNSEELALYQWYWSLRRPVASAALEQSRVK